MKAAHEEGIIYKQDGESLTMLTPLTSRPGPLVKSPPPGLFSGAPAVASLALRGLPAPWPKEPALPTLKPHGRPLLAPTGP
jgi:hypothetical protein